MTLSIKHDLNSNLEQRDFNVRPPSLRQRIRDRYAESPEWFAGKTNVEVAKEFKCAPRAASEACRLAGVKLVSRKQIIAERIRQRNEDGFQCLVAALKLHSRDYREIRRMLGENTALAAIKRVKVERPELAKRIKRSCKTAPAPEDVLRRAKRLYRKRGYFVMDALARHFGTSSSTIRKIIIPSFSSLAAYKRFKRKMEERIFEARCTRAEKVRDQKWLDDIKRVNGLGFEFTGGYWRRYRKLWWRKRRKERPIENPNFPR